MKIIFLSLSLTLFCFASCSEKTQTVEWYKEHPEVLAEEFEKCKSNLATDKHCTIIRQAEKEVFDDRQIDAPLPDIKFK